jgi:hypothetical protein
MQELSAPLFGMQYKQYAISLSLSLTVLCIKRVRQRQQSVCGLVGTNI